MTTREKSVSIPIELFREIVMYSMYEDERTEDRLSRIQRGVAVKLDKMIEHDLYTRYKTEATEEQREAARQQYLDKKGVPSDYRW